MFAQRTSNADKIIEPDISLPAFDPANIGGMESGSLSQLLLRPPLRKSKLPDRLSNTDAVRLIHGPIACKNRR
jgi:hypothetical protein